MSDAFYFWECTADGLTHVVWSVRAMPFAASYTLCEPYEPRPHIEGQDIGGATITCVRCVAATKVRITLQVHDEWLPDVPWLPTPKLDLPIPLFIEDDLDRSW